MEVRLASNLLEAELTAGDAALFEDSAILTKGERKELRPLFLLAWSLLFGHGIATKEPDPAFFAPFEGAVDDGNRSRVVDRELFH